MKSKQMMFMKIFLRIKVCLILVMIHEIQSFFILLVIKVIGKIKYEFKGEIISDFVGLKSKMCSLVNVDGKKNKKAKTVNRNVVKNTRHKDTRHKEFEFVNVLFNKKLIRHRMKKIQSKLRRIGTQDFFKISLSCFNDKRYILDDSINSSAYFQKDITSQ